MFCSKAQTRIGLAEEAVDEADPVIRERERFYRIAAPNLEYYLTQKSDNLFEEERRLQAAGLSAASPGQHST